MGSKCASVEIPIKFTYSIIIIFIYIKFLAVFQIAYKIIFFFYIGVVFSFCYFNLSEQIICINAINENILQRLAGADYDSDTILITDNPVLLAAAKKNYDKFLVPTSCVESTKTKRYYSPEEQCDLDYKTSSNKIGEIVNLSQVLNSLFWDQYNSGTPIEELMPIYYDVCQLSVMSGIEIDFYLVSVFGNKHEKIRI